MRELKFRAWDEEKREMILLPLAGLQYFDFEGSYALSFVVDEYDGFWSHEQYEGPTKNAASFPLMQFTGLLDKNRKEIYEGDVVVCNRYESCEDHVVTIADIRCLPSQLFGSNLNSLEVIGNIYENPDLVTPKT